MQFIHEVFPYLRVRNASEAIAFYVKAFGAEEKFRLDEPSGRVGHAELGFGPFTVMVSDEYPEHNIFGPETHGGTGMAVHLLVDDVDAMVAQVVEAGGKVLMEPQDQFYGQRCGKVLDPYGHEWLIAADNERISLDEVKRRFREMYEKGE